MAYVKPIIPNSIEADGSAVHQTSPAYVLTFIPWVNREIKRDTVQDEGFLNTQNPYIVVNDAINITINDTKANPLKTLQVTLVSTDVNYSAAIHPGDYVFVNIVDFEEHSREIHAKVLARKPINGSHDGFKGYFRVKSVTRSFATGGNGAKIYRYQISATAFSELNTAIIYNPAVQAAYNEKGSPGIFMTLVSEFFKDIAVSVEVDELVRLYLKILLGKSARDKNAKVVQYGDMQFQVPTLVTTLLGLPTSKYVAEVYHLLTGVWSASATKASEAAGFNPSFTRVEDGVYSYKSPIPNQGVKFKIYENWNQKNVWSILNDTSNDTLNEMYTTFRIAPESGRVMPTIVMRQKPFTNSDFVGEIPTTKYLELPRWQLHPGMVYNYNFSTNDALRFNFVQTFAETGLEAAENTQIGLGNFTEDIEDINRNGIRPYIVRSRFGYIAKQTKGDNFLAVKWNKVIADWVMNGHLKENGTITCAGIEEPIATGDNLEFDGTVYHIESITHSFSVNDFGYKSFTTNLGLSHGILLNKTSSKYPEMTQFTREEKAAEDYARNKLMPGVSEEQDRRTTVGEQAGPNKPTKKLQKIK